MVLLLCLSGLVSNPRPGQIIIFAGIISVHALSIDQFLRWRPLQTVIHGGHSSRKRVKQSKKT